MFIQQNMYHCLTTTIKYFTGVPTRNGTRHASEIARLALNILHHTKQLKLPQFPGMNYKIRIGCHSGKWIISSVSNTKELNLYDRLKGTVVYRFSNQSITNKRAERIPEGDACISKDPVHRQGTRLLICMHRPPMRIYT